MIETSTIYMQIFLFLFLFSFFQTSWTHDYGQDHATSELNYD